jgi:hypothetical protein
MRTVAAASMYTKTTGYRRQVCNTLKNRKTCSENIKNIGDTLPNCPFHVKWENLEYNA